MKFHNDIKITSNLNGYNIYDLLSKSSKLDTHTFVFSVHSNYLPQYYSGNNTTLSNVPAGHYYGFLRFDSFNSKYGTVFFIKEIDLGNLTFPVDPIPIYPSLNLIGSPVSFNIDYLSDISIHYSNPTEVLQVNALYECRFNFDDFFIKESSLFSLSIEDIVKFFNLDKVFYVRKIFPNSSLSKKKFPNRIYIITNGLNKFIIEINQFREINVIYSDISLVSITNNSPQNGYIKFSNQSTYPVDIIGLYSFTSILYPIST